ncbi:hypothetical protein H4Q26_015061 [Puccinia striiformis f. sp. tritici PST-130]|nr:hypothetical protein H4Q26_015061 [Puccinia striiformis f. sp. tritici PST-130]
MINQLSLKLIPATKSRERLLSLVHKHHPRGENYHPTSCHYQGRPSKSWSGELSCNWNRKVCLLSERSVIRPPYKHTRGCFLIIQ